MYKTFEMDLAGRKLIVEIGKVTEQANGSALVRCGDTVVLVTATASETPREGIDFFPLSVDFEERLYSVGKIPGGFIKREGKPSEKAILTARLIDRPIRPLFPKGYRNDVQIVATVLSVDTDIPPDIYAMIGSSIALCTSDIPFAGPTGAVVVGLVDGQFVINPDGKQKEKSLLHLVVSGTKDAIMMVEAGAKEVTEEQMLQAILFGHEEVKKIVAFQEQILTEVKKEKKEVPLAVIDPELEAYIREYAYEKVKWSLDTFDRQEREERTKQVKEDVYAYSAETYPDRTKEIDEILYNITKEIVRDKILNEGIRPDGRKMTEIRPIWCEVVLLPRPHGSGLFTRGQTQVLTVATLGAMGDVQILDGLEKKILKDICITIISLLTVLGKLGQCEAQAEGKLVMVLWQKEHWNP